MSLYSVLHLVPRPGGQFVQVAEVVLEICRYTGSDQASYFAAYERPLDWRDEANEDNPVFEEFAVPIAAVIERYGTLSQTKDSPNSYRIVFLDSEWTMQLGTSFDYIRELTGGDFHPANLGFAIGRVHIPAVDFETDQIICGFSVTFSGHGIPIDLAGFLDQVRRNDTFLQLLDYLELLTGVQFDVLMSVYP